MRFCPRPLSWCLRASFVFGLAVTVGCAGAGTSTPTGSGGSSSPGSAGSASPGGGGSSSPGAGGSSGGGTSGVAGTTGAGGVSSPGSAGSTSPGAGGASSPGAGGVAGTSSGAGGVSSGGSAGSSSGGSGGSSTSGAAGTATTGTGGATGAGGTGGICQMAQIKYVPDTPTVYLIVDRSGSMFHCLSNQRCVCDVKTDTSWSTLKTAMQSVVMQLEKEVRFGFTTIFGTDPKQGGVCPLTTGTLADNVPPKLMNYADIKTKYDSLDLASAWPLESECQTSGKKFESPAMYSIRAVTKALMADTTPGSKYILFITDGQEDFCDDTGEICSSDDTVGALQSAFAANIRTIVFGLQTKEFNLPAGVLQAFANAGAGETVVPSLTGSLDTTAIWDQCNSKAPWLADLTASGHPTTRGPTATVGTYGTTKGPTTPFQPNAADQTMLLTELSKALAGVKSCTFDLSDVGGKTIKVDTMKLDQAHVKIEGVEVKLSATDGWNVDAAAPTTLVFSGAACDKWRLPASKNIDLQFPCGTIIFE